MGCTSSNSLDRREHEDLFEGSQMKCPKHKKPPKEKEKPIEDPMDYYFECNENMLPKKARPSCSSLTTEMSTLATSDDGFHIDDLTLRRKSCASVRSYSHRKDSSASSHSLSTRRYSLSLAKTTTTTTFNNGYTLNKNCATPASVLDKNVLLEDKNKSTGNRDSNKTVPDKGKSGKKKKEEKPNAKPPRTESKFRSTLHSFGIGKPKVEYEPLRRGQRF